MGQDSCPEILHCFFQDGARSKEQPKVQEICSKCEVWFTCLVFSKWAFWNDILVDGKYMETCLFINDTKLQLLHEITFRYKQVERFWGFFFHSFSIYYRIGFISFLWYLMRSNSFFLYSLCWCWSDTALDLCRLWKQLRSDAIPHCLWPLVIPQRLHTHPKQIMDQRKKIKKNKSKLQNKKKRKKTRYDTHMSLLHETYSSDL